MRQVLVGMLLGVVAVAGCGQAGDTATAADGLVWFEVTAACDELVVLEAEPRLMTVESVTGGGVSSSDYGGYWSDDGYTVDGRGCSQDYRVRGLW